MHLYIFFSVMFSVLAVSLQAPPNDQKMPAKDPFIEDNKVDDFVYDLTGRVILLTDNKRTGQVGVFRVVRHTGTHLPVVQDPDTKQFYLFKYTMLYPGELKLFRLLWGKGGVPYVVDSQTQQYFRPVLNKYDEVELNPINTSEAVNIL